MTNAVFDAALAAVAAGRIVVISGDRLRGGDIDLMCAAKHVTPEAINFMAKHARGLICMPITEEHAIRLNLSPVLNLSIQMAQVSADVAPRYHE